jgi:addiction module HigA family antidote
MSRMHNPPHPGEVLREWLGDLTVTEAAEALQFSRVTLSKILNGKGGITADMALRLSQWLGTTPDLWLGMQNQYDLWLAGQVKRPAIKPMGRMAA